MSPSAAHNIKCMRSCFVSECNYLAAVASSRGALRVPSERRGQYPTFKPVSRGPKSNRVQIRRTCRVSGLRPTRSELQLNNLVDPLLTSWQPGYTQEHRRGAALQCVGTPIREDDAHQGKGTRTLVQVSSRPMFTMTTVGAGNVGPQR